MFSLTGNKFCMVDSTIKYHNKTACYFYAKLQVIIDHMHDIVHKPMIVVLSTGMSVLIWRYYNS